MSQPPLSTPAAGVDYPGKLLGSIGLIAAILFNIVGLIISVIAYSESKKAGFRNTPALIGIAIGAILFVITIVFVIIGIVAGIAASSMTGIY